MFICKNIIAYFIQEYFECIHRAIAAIIYNNVQADRLPRNKCPNGSANRDMQRIRRIAAKRSIWEKYFLLFDR